MDVAQSRRNGNSSSVGAPIVSGFVPNIGSTPNVGGIDGLALVTANPIIPSLIAISE